MQSAVVCCWGHQQLTNQISTAPSTTRTARMHGHTHFKGINLIFRQAAPIKLKILSERGVRSATSFLVTDFIEHVTELVAHMAAAAA